MLSLFQDPPSGDHGGAGGAEEGEEEGAGGGGEGGGSPKPKRKKHSRTYRLEKTYGVSAGKWWDLHQFGAK